MNTVNVRQGSREWHSARAGRVTASEVSKVLMDPKTETRSGYMAQIISEILTGEPNMEGFLNPYMDRGTAEEPAARDAYAVRENVWIDQVGFVIHPTIERAGSSPDGLIGTDGGVEIKVPKPSNHISYMIAGQLPKKYEPQVMFNLACTEREWYDFVSFDPSLPTRHQLFIKRVYRDEKRIKEINDAVLSFLGEVDDLIAKLDGMNPVIEQLRKAVEIEDGLGITDADIRAVDSAWNGDAEAAQIAAADNRMRELVGGE